MSISVLCHSCNLSCFGRLHAHEGFDLKSIPLPPVLFVGRCCLWFNTLTNRVKTPYHPGILLMKMSSEHDVTNKY